MSRKSHAPTAEQCNGTRSKAPEILYDRDIDVLLVRLGAIERRTRTVAIVPGVLVDVDAGGTPLQIEVLDATERYGIAALHDLPRPDYGADGNDVEMVEAPAVEARLAQDLSGAGAATS